jgi:hypothetical protein
MKFISRKRLGGRRSIMEKAGGGPPALRLWVAERRPSRSTGDLNPPRPRSVPLGPRLVEIRVARARRIDGPRVGGCRSLPAPDPGPARPGVTLYELADPQYLDVARRRAGREALPGRLGEPSGDLPQTSTPSGSLGDLGVPTATTRSGNAPARLEASATSSRSRTRRSGHADASWD